MAENKVVEKSRKFKWSKNLVVCGTGIIGIFALRIICGSVAGFLLDVFYALLFVCLAACFFEELKCEQILRMFKTLGKYSTGMWFFHAVFFSTYVRDLFQPLLKLVSWPPLMFVWLVVLSLAGAFVYQKLLDGLHFLPKIVKRSL